MVIKPTTAAHISGWGGGDGGVGGGRVLGFTLTGALGPDVEEYVTCILLLAITLQF